MRINEKERELVKKRMRINEWKEKEFMDEKERE